jgi:hypothetical protein
VENAGEKKVEGVPRKGNTHVDARALKHGNGKDGHSVLEKSTMKHGGEIGRKRKEKKEKGNEKERRRKKHAKK